MTEKEKAAAGYLYNANYDEEILAEISRCNDLCFEFNQLRPSDRDAQHKILKKIFGKMGENVDVNAPFWCDYGYNTSVGDYFFANRYCQILDGGKVTFGDHVFIAPNCLFTTAEHALDPDQRNAGLEVALPISIGNNVWIAPGPSSWAAYPSAIIPSSGPEALSQRASPPMLSRSESPAVYCVR